MRTSSRTVALLLFDEVELLDVAGLLEVLTTAGRQWNYRPFKIVPVGAKPGFVETRNQIRLEARVALPDCARPEIVLVPGGYGARRALADEAAVAWLRGTRDSATHHVAVGNGVLLLAKAGLVDDRDVAVVPELAEALAELAPQARPDVDATFRESGTVLTAAKSAASLDVALHLVERLLGKKQAGIVGTALGLQAGKDPKLDVDIVERR